MASAEPTLSTRIRERIRDIPDFPRPGINFKDITPLLADGELFREVIHAMAAVTGRDVDRVVGVESRGFIFGAALAHHLGCGFVPVRKPGKLPFRTHRVAYELEYGTDALEAHEDAIAPGMRVVLVDDVLATGGTAAATAQLVTRLGGELVVALFLLELGFLGGRERLGAGVPTHALIRYD
ncbi:MAG TPA: adenine phosphoribosyltransferase [Longimicrobiales bacterium]|nr:adenine phosphoribosyltransferase [Longimicrobiales bacterium]